MVRAGHHRVCLARCLQGRDVHGRKLTGVQELYEGVEGAQKWKRGNQLPVGGITRNGIKTDGVANSEGQRTDVGPCWSRGKNQMTGVALTPPAERYSSDNVSRPEVLREGPRARE